MKTVISFALAMVLGTTVAAAQDPAQDVTFTFTGTITYVDPYVPFPDIMPGTPFTGSYTFNLGTPNTGVLPGIVGDYRHVSPAYGISVQIGSRTFRTDPQNVEFLIELVNNYHSLDNYVVRSYNNLPVDGVPVAHISWQLDDPTQTSWPRSPRRRAIAMAPS